MSRDLAAIINDIKKRGYTLGEALMIAWDEDLTEDLSTRFDVAAAIDAAIAAEREACARVIETRFMEARDTEFDFGFETARQVFAAAVRNKTK